jgi:hypothetical protein
MPIIPQGSTTGKIGLPKLSDGLLTVITVVLASSASFGLGMLAERSIAGEGGGVKIQGVPAGAFSAAAALAPIPKASKSSNVSVKSKSTAKEEPTGTATAETGVYVASKKGTKYHLPTCSGAKTMSEENKIWFTTKEEAEAAGYMPAANCKGL